MVFIVLFISAECGVVKRKRRIAPNHLSQNGRAVTPAGMADETPADVDLICPFCGYNLRGTPGERCSECGKEFDRATMAQSQIPWSHRRKIGRVRAFVKTCWLVTWRPGKLAEEMNRPVSLKDALAFRRVVTGLMCLPWWGWSVWAMVWVWMGKGEWGWPEPNFVIEGRVDSLPVDNPMGRPMLYVRPPWGGILLCVVVGIFWWGATGAASLFCRRRGMEMGAQNRAVSVSYYLFAPMLLMYFPAALLGVIYGLDNWWQLTGGEVPFALNAFLGAFLGISFLSVAYIIWSVPWRVVRRLTHCSAGRTAWAAIGIPLCWLGMAFVGLTIFAVAFLVEFIWASLG